MIRRRRSRRRIRIVFSGGAGETKTNIWPVIAAVIHVVAVVVVIALLAQRE